MRKFLFLALFILPIIETKAQPGSLDLNFGIDGYVPVTINSGLKFQSDGKLVRVTAEGGSITVYRLNTNGTPDNSFGNGGMVTSYVNSFNIQPVSFAIGNDGKIIVLANTSSQDGSFTVPGVALIKYNSNGVLDASFGVNGIIKTLFKSNGRFDIPERVAIQNTGEIVVTSFTQHPSSDIMIRRFDISGNAIGAGGSGTTDPANYTYNVPTTLIVPGGGYTSRSLFFTGNKERLLRFYYNSDFTNIITLTDQIDGKIIVATTDNKLIRFNNDGTLDAAFGIGGVVTTGLSVNKVVIQNNGNIITGGNLNGNLALARYNENGTLDETFGVRGMINGGSSGGGIYDMFVVGNRLYTYGSDNGNPVIGAYVLEQIDEANKKELTTGRSSFEPNVTEEVVKDLSVRVRSNPTQSYFTLLTHSNSNGLLSIRIVDGFGRIVDSKRGIAPNGTLQIGSEFGRGIYFAEVRQGNKKAIVKLIKLSK